MSPSARALRGGNGSNRSVLLACLFFVARLSFAGEVPIVNGGFETPNVGAGWIQSPYSAAGNSNFFGWTVSAGMLFGSIAGTETQVEGTQLFGANMNPPGQDFNTFTLKQYVSGYTVEPGAAYALRFAARDLNGAGVQFMVSLKFNGVTVSSLSGSTTSSWITYALPTFVASESNAGSPITIEITMANSKDIQVYPRLDAFHLASSKRDGSTFANLIGRVDYSDEFTVTDGNARTRVHDLDWYGTSNVPGLYLTSHDNNPLTAYYAASGMGFRTDGTASRTAAGNAGASSGVLDFQNGSETRFAYFPARRRFVVEFSVLLASDRTDITVSNGDSASANDPSSLSLFVRPNGFVDIYNSVKGQMPTGWYIGAHTRWVKIAAIFDKGTDGVNQYGHAGGTIELIIDDQSLGIFDLTGTQFAGLIGSASICLGTAGTGGVIDNLKVGLDVYPSDGDRRISGNLTLGWPMQEPGDLYDVYFDTDYRSVVTATTNSTVFKGTVNKTEYAVGLTSPKTTHYWRVDTRSSSGTMQGPVHYFVASPSANERVALDVPILADGFTAPGTDRDAHHDFTWYALNRPSAQRVEIAPTPRSWVANAPSRTFFRNRPTPFGNSGANTGLLEMNDSCIATSLGSSAGNRFVIEFDAVISSNLLDHIAINCGSRSGIIGTPGVLSVFLRRSHPQWNVPIIGLYDSVQGEKNIYRTTGLTDFEWHHFAAVFDLTARTIEVLIDNRPVALLDLKVLYGGSFQALLSNVNIGIGCSGTALVDNVQAGPYAPAKPNHPQPVDGAGVQNNAVFSWSPGAGRSSGYDIYFGSDYSAVLNATTNSANYKGRQADISYNPGPLVEGNHYFWRVDQVNGALRVKGDVWKFSVIDKMFKHGIAAPTQLVYVDTRKSPWSSSELILLTSLQGLVARTRPELFIVQNDAQLAYLHYVDTNFGIPYHNLDDLKSTNETSLDYLLNRYSGYYKGYVMADLTYNAESPGVAASLAGLDSHVVASPTLKALMTAHGIPLAMDVRTWSSQRLRDTYWNRFSHKGYVGALPWYTWALYDWAAADNQAMFWNSDPYFNAQMMDSVARNSISLGWDSASKGWTGEGGFTSQNAAHGIANCGIITPNTTAYAGMASLDSKIALLQQNRPSAYAPEENVHYVAFVVGDNDSALEGIPFRGYEGSAFGYTNRGAIKMNWIANAFRSRLAPALQKWFYDNATTNDFFADYFTGEYIQYGYPEFDEYYRQVGNMMQESDLRVYISQFGVPSDAGQRQVWTAEIGSKLAAVPSIRGVFNWGSPNDGQIYVINGKPFINQKYFLCPGSGECPPGALNAKQLAAAINAASTNTHSPAAYSFVNCSAPGHKWAPYEVAVSAAAQFGSHVRVVSMEEMVERINANLINTTNGTPPFMTR